MACRYTIDGTTYNLAEFKAFLVDGGLDRLFPDGRYPFVVPGVDGMKPARMSGVSVNNLQEMVNRIAGEYKGLPTVHVLSNASDAPAALRNEIERQGASNTVEGAMHGGEIYLFADNLSSIERAEFVLAEHEVTHIGLRGILGDALLAEMNKLYRDNARIRKLATEYQKQSPVSNAVAVEEVLADMTADELTDLKGWRGLVQKLADWFRAHGFNRVADMLAGDQADSDRYAAELVKRAREYVRGSQMANTSDVRLSNPDASTIRVLHEITKDDEVFRHPISNKKDLRGIMAEVFPGAKYAYDNFGAGKKITVFDTPTDRRFWVFEENGKVWIDVSNLKQGGYGGAIYAAVGNYAHNSGQQFIGDPSGLSADAVLRRTNAMLSLALKFKSTDFLGSSPEQAKGDATKGIKPLQWGNDYEQNILNLIDTIVSTTEKNVPAIRSTRYDFESGNYTSDFGRVRPRDWAESIAKTEAARGIRAGESTLRRAVVLKSITSSSPSEKSKILRELASVHGLARSGLDSLFSRGNPVQKAKAKLEALRLKPETIDKLIYEFQDKYVDLKRLRDHIKKMGGTINDLNDAYEAETRYHGRMAKRTKDFLEDELRPLLGGLRAASISMEEFEQFLHARHAPEANAEMAKRNPSQAEIDAGQQAAKDAVKDLQNQLAAAKKSGSATKAIDDALRVAQEELKRWNGAQAFKGSEVERLALSGMSDAEARAIIDGLPPAKRLQMDQLAEKVDAINDKTLVMLEEYGLMSRESLNAWRRAYRYYVPLHRDEAHPDSASHPIGQGFSTRGDAARQRVGSNAKVTHILGHIAMQREAAITRGEKNNVMKSLYLMARQNPLPDYWTTEIPKQSYIDSQTGFVRTGVDPLYKQRPNVLMLRVAGKDTAIVFNEHNPQAMRLAAALKNMDIDQMHSVFAKMAPITRFFASISTQFNPIFGAVNLVRDLQTAMINLTSTELSGAQNDVGKYAWDLFKAVSKNGFRMPESGKWAEIYDDFQNVGGQTGYRDLYLTAADRSKAIESQIRRLEIDAGKHYQNGEYGKAALDGVRQIWNASHDWLSDYNEAFENIMRVAAYQVAVERGMSKQKAAVLAKDLTTNFNRKGALARDIGAWYAFFNANMQGTARIYQTLKGPYGGRIIQGGVVIGALNAIIGLAMMGGGDGEDDEWAKIPEHIKERNLIIPLSHDRYTTIPMPPGFHVLHNAGRIWAEGFFGGKAYQKDPAKRMLGILIDSFNPIGGGDNLALTVTPTPLDPVVSIWINEDAFGRRIYREDMSDIDPTPGFTRTRDATNPFWKWVAKKINLATGGTDYAPGDWSPTPEALSYVVGQLTGGVGREVLKAADTIGAIATDEELPPYKIPLVGRFYGNTRGQAGQADEFYENLRESNIIENELKGRMKDGKPTDDFEKENPNAFEIMAYGNMADKQVKALREQRDYLKANKAPSAEIQAVSQGITEAMKDFNRRMRELN